MNTRFLIMTFVFVICCCAAVLAQPARVKTNPGTLDIELSSERSDFPLKIILVGRDGKVVPATRETVLTFSWTSVIGDLRDENGNLLNQVTLRTGQESATVFFRPVRAAGSASLKIAPTDRVLFGTEVLIVLYERR